MAENNSKAKNAYDLSSGNRVRDLRSGQRPPSGLGANPYTGTAVKAGVRVSAARSKSKRRRP